MPAYLLSLRLFRMARPTVSFTLCFNLVTPCTAVGHNMKTYRAILLSAYVAVKLLVACSFQLYSSVLEGVMWIPGHSQGLPQDICTSGCKERTSKET